ncbi:30S ribosome-binding factor RbfA [Candidatus Uhrbacteria bacterium]|nr:30S ribosome-binding factor RbfA [Candidatus Uhrbacteria bacterium]
MAAKRIDKLNTLIAQELAKIISREVEFELGTLTTITRVKTSDDLKYASVFITIYPDARRGSALTLLKKRRPYLQHLLNESIPLQHVPHLRFLIESEDPDAPSEVEQEVERILDTLIHE